MVGLSGAMPWTSLPTKDQEHRTIGIGGDPYIRRGLALYKIVEGDICIFLPLRNDLTNFVLLVLLGKGQKNSIHRPVGYCL